MVGFFRRVLPLFVTLLIIGFCLAACGGLTPPPLLGGPKNPSENPNGTNGPGAGAQAACTLQFQAKLVLNLVSSVADLADFEQVISDPIPIHVANNSDFLVLGEEFPPIVFSKEENPSLGSSGVNSITISGILGSQGRGSLDQNGNLNLIGLGLHVSSDPNIVSADLTDLTFTTGNTPSVTGVSELNPPSKSLSATGSPLDFSTLKMSLATAITIPASVPLLGNGAVTALLDGTGTPGGLDKSPQDPSCSGGSTGGGASAGPSDLLLKRLEGSVEKDVSGNLLAFGEVFAGEGRKKDIPLRIKNQGIGTLTISDFEKSEEFLPFSVVGSDGNPIDNLSLAPGAARDVKIRFQPETVLGSEEFLSGAITIHSNDPNQSILTLFVSGVALESAPRIDLKVLMGPAGAPLSAYAAVEEVDFGTIYFPNLTVIPQKVLKSFRLTNTGSEDLVVTDLAPMTNEFTYGMVRLGVNTSRACAEGQDPLNPADNCSILVTQKFFGTPAEKGPVALPPADLENLQNAPHLEILVGYQPVNFNALDQSTLTVKAQGDLLKTVRLIGHTDASTEAKVKLFIDPTPGDATDVPQEVLVEAGKVYNFGVFASEKTTGQILVRVQNGGGAGGDLLKIVSADVALSGDGSFTLDKSVFDTSLVSGLAAPSGIADGRKNLAKIQVTRPADRREIRSAQLQILAKSLNLSPFHEIALPPFTVNIVYGLPSGDLTFMVKKLIVGIKSPATAKPISTLTGSFTTSLPLKLDFNNKGSVQLAGVLSRQPNFEGAPACTGDALARRSCAMGLAPFRFSMRALADNWDDADQPNDQGASPAGVCAEGDYDGHWEVTSPAECSYMAVSLGGSAGTDFHDQAAAISDSQQSTVVLDLAGRKARLSLRSLKIRFLDTEHALMLGGADTYFDHIPPLALTTGPVTTDLTGLSFDTFVPLEGADHSANNINTSPLDVYICDGAGDADLNPSACLIPPSAPAGTGLLLGNDYNLNTGDVVLVGVTKLTDESRQNPGDEFFDLLGPSPLYLVLKGKICGDSIGVPCL